MAIVGAGNVGAACYAVAAGLMRIVEAILRNRNTVLSVSSLIDGYYDLSDVCLSLPAVINRNGVARVLRLEKPVGAGLVPARRLLPDGHRARHATGRGKPCPYNR
ncbi:MAG TPA: hypothetical protein VJQ56_02880 [Blastocatellia bacterium]|nr:hypothetical protein [Blastocatellia bacterium]